jgi:pimeloyl-ACP methyl ester carboxylesterase
VRLLGRLVLVVIVLAAVTGLVFWREPLWTDMQFTHLGLFFSRVQSNYVMTPEGRVHYYEAEPRFAPEHGIPLVLVHGLADRDESWAPMLKRLKKAGFHVYALDLLGYGRSPKPADSDYSIATEEQFVADFIQSLGLQKPDVGGWSMGGWITLKLALDHPEMVNRVIVYDTAGLHTGQTMPDKRFFHPTTPDDVQALFHAMEPEEKPLPAFVAKDAIEHFASTQAVIDKQLAGMEAGKDALDDTVSKLTAPLLIVWGQNDQLVPLAVGQKLHELVPTSELDILEGCGHLAPVHCSGRVSQATVDFLKANPIPVGQVRTLAAMGR